MKMIFPDCIGIKSNVKIIVCVGIKGLMKYHKNHLKDKILLILTIPKTAILAIRF